MAYKSINHKDVLIEIENEYVTKYPKVINKIELYLTELITKLEIINNSLIQISINEPINNTSAAFVDKLSKHIKSFNEKRFQYLNLPSLNELIELSLEFPKHHKLIAIHSIEAQAHGQNQNAWKSLENVTRGLKAPINRLKKEIDKNIVILKYIASIFDDVMKSLKKLSKDFLALDGIENMDSYVTNFNILFNKSMPHTSKPNTKITQSKQTAYQYVEQAILIKKLEMLLEYPKQLAFQYKIKDRAYTLSNKKPESFTSILNSIGSPSFVRHKILTFKLEDILYTLRELYATDEDEPDQYYSGFGADMNFDEDVFIELYISYHKVSLDLEFSSFHNFDDAIADYQSQMANDYKIVKESGNKIIEQFNRIVRYNIFNDSFNEFREKMQIFFFEEFNVLVDLYYN